MKIKEVIGEYDTIWAGLTALAATILSYVAQIVATPPTLWREAPQVPYVAELVVIVVLAAGIAGNSAARRSKVVWGLRSS